MRMMLLCNSYSRKYYCCLETIICETNYNIIICGLCFEGQICISGALQVSY